MTGGNGQLGICPHGSLQRDGHFLARVRGELTARGRVAVLVAEHHPGWPSPALATAVSACADADVRSI